MTQPKTPFRAFLGLTSLLLWMWGCAPKTPGPVVTEPPPPPRLEKTYGEILVGEGSTLQLFFKNMHLMIDPTELPGNLAPLDYLLLTDDEDHHMDSNLVTRLRPNLKVIASPAAKEKLNKKSFGSVKSLVDGEKLLLKKDDAFLFASAIASQNAATGKKINSYLLEFDIGRNVFIAGELNDVASLREMVYSLRDDGKEAHIAIFYGGKSEDVKAAVPDELGVAEMIGILQPRMAVVISSGRQSLKPLDRKILSEKLKDELYHGVLIMAGKGEKIEF